MGPLPLNSSFGELFRQLLIDVLDPNHPLMKLADVIDRPTVKQSFGEYFTCTPRRPTRSPRLVTTLLQLQCAYDCSDESMAKTWIENPYCQYITGETYFQTGLAIDPSSMTNSICTRRLSHGFSLSRERVQAM